MRLQDVAEVSLTSEMSLAPVWRRIMEIYSSFNVTKSLPLILLCWNPPRSERVLVAAGGGILMYDHYIMTGAYIYIFCLFP